MTNDSSPWRLGAPIWLDVDRLGLTDEMRAGFAAIEADALALVPEVLELSLRFRVAEAGIANIEGPAWEIVWPLLSSLSGHDAAMNALSLLTALLAGAGGDVCAGRLLALGAHVGVTAADLGVRS